MRIGFLLCLAALFPGAALADITVTDSSVYQRMLGTGVYDFGTGYWALGDYEPSSGPTQPISVDPIASPYSNTINASGVAVPPANSAWEGASVAIGGQNMLSLSGKASLGSLELSASATAQMSGSAAPSSLSGPPLWSAFSEASAQSNFTATRGLRYQIDVNLTPGVASAPLYKPSVVLDGNQYNASGTFSGVLGKPPAGIDPITHKPFSHTFQVYDQIRFGGKVASLQDSAAASAHVTLQELPPLRVLSIGVNWLNSSDSTLRGANAKADANLTYSTFGGLPSFSASQPPVILEPNAAPGINAMRVDTAFAQFADQLRGTSDTAIIFMSSHGFQANGTSYLALGDRQSDGSLDVLSAQNLAADLGRLPPSSHKIVFVDSCHSAGFLQSILGVPNTAIVTATARLDETTNSDPAHNGLGFMTEYLNQLVGSGVYDLDTIVARLKSLNTTALGGLLGQQFPLMDSGDGPFTGLDPAVYRTADFSGDLLGPPISVPEPNVAWIVVACVALVALRRPRRCGGACCTPF